jgi:hypothetical protein
MIIIGSYFKSHIYINIGDSGISIPVAKKDIYKWIYAQAIGPKLLINNGIMTIILSLILDVVLILEYGFIIKYYSIGIIVGTVFLLSTMTRIEYEVNNFSPKWLIEDNYEKKKQWLEKTISYAANGQYEDFYAFILSSNY